MSALLLLKARPENSAGAQEQNGLPTPSDLRPWDLYLRTVGSIEQTFTYSATQQNKECAREGPLMSKDLQIINAVLT